MTRVKVTYVAMDLNRYKPIMTASTFEDLRVGLDDYYGVHKGEAECWGFDRFDSKYPDDYEGYFTYAWKNPTRAPLSHYEVTVVKDKVKVFCVDYHPYTTYEV